MDYTDLMSSSFYHLMDTEWRKIPFTNDISKHVFLWTMILSCLLGLWISRLQHCTLGDFFFKKHFAIKGGHISTLIAYFNLPPQIAVVQLITCLVPLLWLPVTFWIAVHFGSAVQVTFYNHSMYKEITRESLSFDVKDRGLNNVESFSATSIVSVHVFSLPIWTHMISVFE